MAPQDSTAPAVISANASLLKELQELNLLLGEKPASLPGDLQIQHLSAGSSSVKEACMSEDMQRINDVLEARQGYVSPLGLERAARALELECLWGDDRNATKTLSIAGEALLIDIDFLDNVVQAVNVEFPGCGEKVEQWKTPVARLLHTNLTMFRFAPLAPFVENLKCLARLDKTNCDGFNGCAAVAGVQAALVTMHDKLTRSVGSDLSSPKLHQNRIGLQYTYCHLHSLYIACARSADVPTIRASDCDWIKHIDEDSHTWTYPKGPHTAARFEVLLDPPIILPFVLAVHILTILGAPVGPRSDLAVALNITLVCQKSVSTPGQDRRTHHYRLSAPNDDPVYRLSAFSCVHPQQIVNLLPSLRQWAMVGKLLKSALTVLEGEMIDRPEDEIDDPNFEKVEFHMDDSDDESDPVYDSIEDEMAAVQVIQDKAILVSALEIDISLTLSSALPTFSLRLFVASEGTLTLKFSVAPDGRLEKITYAVEDNDDPFAGFRLQPKTAMTPQQHETLSTKIGKILQMSLSIPVLVEWVLERARRVDTRVHVR